VTLKVLESPERALEWDDEEERQTRQRGKGKGIPTVETLTPALPAERGEEAWPHDLAPELSLPD